MDKDIGPPSDEGELTSEASMTPVRCHSQGKGESCEAIMSLADSLAQVVSLGDAAAENVNRHDGNAVRTAKRSAIEDSIASTKKPLHLLDLPMDILQVIVKEVS